MPGGDRSSTATGPCSDKQNDKHSDKRILQDPELAKVIAAWPELPDPVKAGILAMVKAATQPDKNGTDGPT